MNRQMETALIVAMLAVILASGLHCSMGTNDNRLQGTWQWTQSVGGLAGWTLTPATEGYTQRLELGPGNRFAFFRADSLMADGTYTLATEGDRPVLHYQTASSWWLFANGQQIRRQAPDTLILRDRCADCYTHTFVRR